MASSAGTMPNTGRWGWYKDHEGNEFRRVSTLIKKVETDTHALEEWKKRQVLLGAAKRNDILLGVKALGEVPVLGWSQQQKKQIGAWAEECMTAAGSDTGRISGTAVHDLTERLDRGEDIASVVQGLPAPFSHDLRAYAKLRQLNGWKSVEIERTVVCDELDVAGSFDRIDIVPGLVKLLGPARCQHGHSDHIDRQADDPKGELPVIVDVKTEGSPLLNGLHIGPQLAIYSRAKRMWLPPDSDTFSSATYVDAPCVRQDVAVIVHVRDGKAIPYFVDLNAGWEAAQAAARQLERERASKKWFAPVPGIVEPKPAEILTEVAVSGRYGYLDRTPSGLATAMLDASKVTATALGPAPMPTDMPNPDRGDMTGAPIGVINEPGIQIAVTRLDGLVEFRPTQVGDPAPDRALAQALTSIALAKTLEDLSDVYRTWTDTLGLAWVGRVAAAGDARRKVIECPQPGLHRGGGKCACGWTEMPF